MDILDRLLAQMHTLKELWPSFLVLMGIAAVLVWRAIDWRYRAVVDGLNHRIKLREDEIAYLAKEGAAVQEAAEPAVRPLAALLPSVDDASELKIPTVDELMREIAPFRYTQPIEDRIFITKYTGPELIHSLWGKTSVQERRVIEPYLGKWLKVSLAAGNVIQRDDETLVMLPVPDARVAFIWLHFAGDRDRLELVEIGDTVTAIGRINELSGTAMRLYACELLAINET